MDWQRYRQTMVDSQIRDRGIVDSKVLAAMSRVPRHEFVPVEERQRAYSDSPIAIGLGQTISQPYIVALMTAVLQLEPTHRVLEVGTGSGYQTAVLAELAAEVFTVEIHAALQELARERLNALGYRNIHFDIRNGYAGWLEAAPFDRIIVTAGAPEIPEALIDQMAPESRLVIPVGPPGGDQILQTLTKTLGNRIDIRDVVPVRFVPLVNQLESR